MEGQVIVSQADLEAARALAAQFQSVWVEEPLEAVERDLAVLAGPDYHWRGSRPFYEHAGTASVCEGVLAPLRRALDPLKRREYMAFAGINDADDAGTVWTCSLGVFSGPLVREWLGLRPTHKLVQLRYAEFQEVQAGTIAQTALFIDLCDFLQQIGLDPFPQQLGARGIFPPPLKPSRSDQSPEAAAATMALVNRMRDDLDLLNQTGNDTCPPEYLARTWHEDMAWYGPAGIGAMMTIPLYQQQHQYPFRLGLANKRAHGHIARIAQGDHAAFFGWPNLSNSPRGGYLGLPASDVRGEMRIVDVYRREGERLAENWVIIDLPHYFACFGIDLLGRAIAAQMAG